MGTSKLLLPWGQTTMLGQTLRHLLVSTADALLVVTGHQAAAVTVVAAAHGVPTLYNHDYARGEMTSSLQAAVRSLPPGVAGVLVALADQPLIPPDVFDQVMSAFRQGAGAIVAPTYAGRRGHPVLFGRRLFADLLALPLGASPRHLLRRYPDTVYHLPVESDTILLDLDRPEDYERYRPQYGKENDATT